MIDQGELFPEPIVPNPEAVMTREALFALIPPTMHVATYRYLQRMVADAMERGINYGVNRIRTVPKWKGIPKETTTIIGPAPEHDHDGSRPA